MQTPPRLLALLPTVVLAVALAATPAAAAEQPGLGPGVVTSPGAGPPPPNLTGTSWLVTDMDTGAIYGAKDARHRLLPASTLKVLTALTLIPRIQRTALITPSFSDVNVEGSRVGLIENEKYPAYQLFRALLIVSGNDAANALASAAGGQAETARLMNAEAARLGAVDTYAVNPSGLDAPGQRTTAYDLALIARAAMKLPDFRAYVATKRTSINGKNGQPLPIASHDRVLWNYDGAIGIKNGYTIRAGATYIGAATRNGHTMLVTVMHAQARVWPEVDALLDWGFAAERAGATPISRLVDPTAPRPAEPMLAGRAHVQSTAAANPTTKQGVAMLPLTIVAAGLGGMVLAFIRRRRRVRNPLRLRLPL